MPLPSRIDRHVDSAAPRVPPVDATTPVAGLPLIYFDHGYQAGYRQAVTDLLASLVPLSEQFIRTQPGRSEDVRRLLYPFEAYLESRIERMTPDTTFVEGGLGI